MYTAPGGAALFVGGFSQQWGYFAAGVDHRLHAGDGAVLRPAEVPGCPVSPPAASRADKPTNKEVYVMSTNFWKSGAAAAAGLLIAGSALAQSGVSFKDPANDDNGPGSYTYPTDGVYKRGSFDMTGFTSRSAARRWTSRSPSTPPSRTPGGWAAASRCRWCSSSSTPTQGGRLQGRPVRAPTSPSPPADAWDKLVILSPQPPGTREERGGHQVPAAMQGGGHHPDPRQGRRPDDLGSVDLDQLGGGDPSQWGYQVVMQSNEGFPDRQRPADPQGQRVRGPAPLRRRHRQRLRSARRSTCWPATAGREPTRSSCSTRC